MTSSSSTAERMTHVEVFERHVVSSSCTTTAPPTSADIDLDSEAPTEVEDAEELSTTSDDLDEEEFQRQKQLLLERRRQEAQMWAQKMTLIETLSRTINERESCATSAKTDLQAPAEHCARPGLGLGLDSQPAACKSGGSKSSPKWYQRGVLLFFIRNLALSFIYHLKMVSIRRMLRIDDSEPWSNEESFLSPLRRYFASGRRVLPLPRVFLYLVFGVCLSCVVLVVTEDPFLFGTASASSSDFQVDAYSNYPVHLAFHNLGCKGTSLKSVSGVIRPGTITAIIGPSGAGKSSLAQFLLGRADAICRKGYTGSIFLNGKQRSLNSILDRVGFVPQEDVLYADLTVEEGVMFSARWKLPRAATDADRRAYLNKTLESLGLEKVRDHRIGKLLKRGISGGEKKRVSIAYEMIAQPSVLVMDEPTSGLDSAAAFTLMKILRKITRRGISVVLALHVPSNRIWQLIDDLILLQEGQEVYVGPRENVTKTFKAMGYDFAKTASTEVTLPEYLLDVISGNVQREPSEIPSFPDSNLNSNNAATGASNGHTSQASLNASSAHPPRELPALWRKLEGDELMNRVHKELKLLRANEESATGEAESEDGGAKGILRRLRRKKTRDWLGKCDLIQNKHARKTCIVLRGFRFNTPYPRLSKPGLLQQMIYWLDIIIKIQWRSRAIMFDLASCVLIAGICGWVRSYSSVWEERVQSASFMSIGISCIGAFSPVFGDNVEPVRRAAQSGMLLGANNWAMVVYSAGSSVVQSVLFTFVFHLMLFIRRPSRQVIPTFWRFVEFAFLCCLLHGVSFSMGFLICVIANHRFSKSSMFTIAFTMITHVFSRFNPNPRQIRLDSFITINGRRYSYKFIVELICAISPARYFIEAMFLWDHLPSPGMPEDKRKFTMKYFDFRDEHLNACTIMLFYMYTSLVMIRYLWFAAVNSTDFHTLYDTPIAGRFLLKVQLAFIVVLFVALCWNEINQGAVSRRARCRLCSRKVKNE